MLKTNRSNYFPLESIDEPNNSDETFTVGTIEDAASHNNDNILSPSAQHDLNVPPAQHPVPLAAGCVCACGYVCVCTRMRALISRLQL